MSSTATWRERLGWPHGYLFVVLVALAAAVGAGIIISLVGSRANNVFWEEFWFDRNATWLSFALVLFAPFLAKFCRFIPMRRIGNLLQQRPSILFVTGAVLYAILMLGMARQVPYTPDEWSAILQARTFAAGHLTPRVAPDLLEWIIPHQIQGDFILLSQQDGRYTSAYWPGYSLLMAPFALLHLEWACNPVLTVLTLWLIMRLTQRLTGSEEGGVWAVVLTLSASQIALHAATYMSMPSHLLFDILFCLCFIRNSARSAFAAGLVGGFALVLHNPVAHFSFAFPWIVWQAVYRRSRLWPLLLGYALLVLPMGLGWSAHLGTFDRGHFPDDAVVRNANSSSRFAEVVARISYAMRPPDELLLLARAAGIIKLIIWAVPGTAGLALLGWLQTRRERQLAKAPTAEHENTHYLWLLGVSLTFNFILYLFTRFDQGHGWGFRYLHQSWLALPILAAAFLIRQNSGMKKLVALLSLSGLLILLPPRADVMSGTIAFTEQKRPPFPPSTPSIAFIYESPQGIVFIQNDPFLRNPDWHVRFQSPTQNEALARRYLANAHKTQSGDWGELWTGSSLLRPGSP